MVVINLNCVIDTNEYIPIVQKRSRLEKTLNEVELKSQRAEERCVSLQEDVHAIRGQISILNHAVLKMEVESKSKGTHIEFIKHACFICLMSEASFSVNETDFG